MVAQASSTLPPVKSDKPVINVGTGEFQEKLIELEVHPSEEKANEVVCALDSMFCAYSGYDGPQEALQLRSATEDTMKALDQFGSSLSLSDLAVVIATHTIELSKRSDGSRDKIRSLGEMLLAVKNADKVLRHRQVPSDLETAIGRALVRSCSALSDAHELVEKCVRTGSDLCAGKVEGKLPDAVETLMVLVDCCASYRDLSRVVQDLKFEEDKKFWLHNKFAYFVRVDEVVGALIEWLGASVAEFEPVVVFKKKLHDRFNQNQDGTIR